MLLHCMIAFVELQGSMTVQLHSFQKADLAWMQFREQVKPTPQASGGVSADESGSAPVPVSGGLYANEPGLGKTVTTIALILSSTRRKVCGSSIAW